MDAVDAGVPIGAVNDAFGEAAFQTHEHQQLSALDKFKGSPPAVFHVLQDQNAKDREQDGRSGDTSWRTISLNDALCCSCGAF